LNVSVFTIHIFILSSICINEKSVIGSSFHGGPKYNVYIASAVGNMSLSDPKGNEALPVA
jgi:hypothetical protein